MSASTLSATANPRRRTSSTVNDVKQSIDIAAATTTVNGGDEKLTAVAKETVLERSSKETTTPVKKPSSRVPNPSSETRNRTRKPVKPRWKTVLSVLLKNLMLVVVVLGLVQMIRKLGVKDDLSGSSMLGFEDMEGRISSVEKLIKTLSKMLQVQVEVVDKKVDSEVGNLRGEVKRRVEDLGVEIEGKLTELKAKNKDLEVGLRELRDVSKGFVSKDDVIRLYNEFISGKGGNEVSLDEIRVLAREIVENEIEKHKADGLGRVDYALASGGARVVKHSDPLMVEKGIWFAAPRQGVHENAVRMLSPSFGEPGMCFALKGSSGFVDIRLRTAIVPEAVTLEHVAKSVAYDLSSAPKDCRVLGWLQGPQSLDADSKAESEKIVLAEFTYDLQKSNAQTTNVIDSAVSAVVDTIRFEFSSNHGSLTHTCIYRLRVHGHDPNPVPKVA